MERIVVGVDGSPHAQGALQWAAREAKLRGAELVVVAAWEFPYYATFPATMVVVPSTEELVTATKEMLRHALEGVDVSGLRVHEVVAEGPPAHVLLDTAKDAELLVVGSRGRGGFAGLMLGSVSQHCAHHARCPVVIVHTDR